MLEVLNDRRVLVARPLVQPGARIDLQNQAERSPLQMTPPGLASDLQQLAPPSVEFTTGADGSTVAHKTLLSVSARISNRRTSVPCF
ncbi:hypothetical protein FJT64_022565 [Amphibalanus amphitrite]|uniref:Uncharacterized protein n=1 Tax=Amphibalanus amphitrite TaxID=1232801 RepID=A0A6A4WUX1_AMPAM|nr:hypothetical protein FJT64_022565 [Amphibalanus amphitrite]